MNESTPSSPNMLSSFSKKCSTVFLHHLQTFSMSCLINIQLCNPISCVSRPKKSRCVKRRDGWCRRFKDIFHPLVSLTNLNMSVYRVKKKVKQFVKTAELGGRHKRFSIKPIPSGLLPFSIFSVFLSP